jgi:hypothetical protein
MKRTSIESMIGWLDALRRDDFDLVGAMLDPEIVWRGLREDLVCHGPGQAVGICNVFAIEARRVWQIDDFAKRDEALAAAWLDGSSGTANQGY